MVKHELRRCDHLRRTFLHAGIAINDLLKRVFAEILWQVVRIQIQLAHGIVFGDVATLPNRRIRIGRNVVVGVGLCFFRVECLHRRRFAQRHHVPCADIAIGLVCPAAFSSCIEHQVQRRVVTQLHECLPQIGRCFWVVYFFLQVFVFDRESVTVTLQYR